MNRNVKEERLWLRNKDSGQNDMRWENDTNDTLQTIRSFTVDKSSYLHTLQGMIKS